MNRCMTKVKDKMKSEKDLLDLLELVCEYYDNYRNVCGMDHKQSVDQIKNMYHDLHHWLYVDEG